MKIKVTRQDIEDGRFNAGHTCGCPIWYALSRRLNIFEIESSQTLLEIPSVYQARIGRITIPLPKKAVKFQLKLMENVNAEVKPFTFNSHVGVRP